MNNQVQISCLRSSSSLATLPRTEVVQLSKQQVLSFHATEAGVLKVWYCSVYRKRRFCSLRLKKIIEIGIPPFSSPGTIRARHLLFAVEPR